MDKDNKSSQPEQQEIHYGEIMCHPMWDEIHETLKNEGYSTGSEQEYDKLFYECKKRIKAIIMEERKSQPPEQLQREESYQLRVDDWMQECFGPKISKDKQERNHRFIEEALELVQACGATESECMQLVKYVYERPVGERTQEVGGVMVTLAALCSAQSIDMNDCGETELKRIWTKVEKIREKQQNKPKHSPLPCFGEFDDMDLEKQIIDDAKTSALIIQWYGDWCKRTKRSGGILITTSIKDLLTDFYNHVQPTSPTAKEQ